MHRLMRGGAARRSFELLVETGVLDILSPYLAGLLEGSGAPATPPPVAAIAPRPTVPLVEYEEEDPADRDSDDPDEPDDDADGDAAADAADAAESTATADVDELDDEEQAWHRVWADVPVPVRTASAAAAHTAARKPAAPVRLSFVPNGAELDRRRALAWSTLAQIDLAIAAGRDPSNAVAFAALLAPFLPDEIRGADLHGVLQEIAAPLIDQLHVTRRDSERLRYLLMAQRKLASARRRGVQAELAGGRELIDDALLLHDLLERAAGRDPGEAPVPTIVPDEGRDDDAEELDANGEPRKRRRRRRGGQRRRHG
jgi:hypothetical protein